MRTSRLSGAVGLELAAIARRSGRILLFGQVPTLESVSEFSGDVCIWTRWAEPVETGLEGARLEFAAATPRDNAARTARVVARAAPTNRRYARNVYSMLEIQGMIDLLVVGPAAPDGSRSELVHVLACADLTQKYTPYGLSVIDFPKHYV